MIAFVTLFLGLVAGAQVVELAVPADVARVELRLDGEAVASLDGSPWRAQIELGPELLPRRLKAAGYAADGSPLDVAEQWLNLPGTRRWRRSCPAGTRSSPGRRWKSWCTGIEPAVEVT